MAAFSPQKRASIHPLSRMRSTLCDGSGMALTSIRMSARKPGDTMARGGMKNHQCTQNCKGKGRPPLSRRRAPICPLGWMVTIFRTVVTLQARAREREREREPFTLNEGTTLAVLHRHPLDRNSRLVHIEDVVETIILVQASGQIWSPQ